MKIHYIRNHTMIIELFNQRFLINPEFAPKGFFLSAAKETQPRYNLPISPKEIIKNINAVIITGDYDKFAIDVLPKNTKIFVLDEVCKKEFEKEHFKNVDILQNDNNIEVISNCIVNNNKIGAIFKTEKESLLCISSNKLQTEILRLSIDTYKPKYVVLYSTAYNNNQLNDNIEYIKELHKNYNEIKFIVINIDNANSSLTLSSLRQQGTDDYIYVPAVGEMMILE